MTFGMQPGELDDLARSTGLAVANIETLCRPAPGLLPANENIRKALFAQLMTGYSIPDGAGNRLRVDSFVRNIGMRPNLHVGRMVNTFQKPSAPRFVHVAAQIFAQVVVTKPMANRLLKVIHKPKVAYTDAQSPKWTQEDINMHREAMRVLGVDVGGNWENQNSFFGVDRCLLVYMAAAVLHPNQGM
jgi:hypothetical protein